MKRLLVFWESLGTGPGIAALIVRCCVYITLLFLAYACVTVQLNWIDQLVLGILTVGLAYLMHRMSKSEMITMALMYASMLATARYAYWRISTLVDTFRTQGLGIGVVDIFLMLLLLSAEVYAFVILYLGFMQTIRPLRRPPVPLPGDVSSWPDVDVLIPTYNESLTVVRSTVFAALNMDYPEEKLHVYLLDDGRREEFRSFCGEVGCGYVTRTDNAHAKAGNINHALTLIHSPLTAIFDCDHVPTRSFLQTTLGWFNKDEKLGMLQTPHYFYSLDPFERNLKQFTAIPNEGELFYGVVQDGNDLWDATFFCGSCAVLRRTALDEIGGIATETVTEDAHTSLRMQSRGWNSAYINIPQAGGLATESLAGHVGQRVRWARGMVQIFRTDNPLFVPGLRWHQRLCYLNTMLHFFYAMPRLIFLTGPLIYMLLGMRNIPGYWVAIVAYAMPHLYLANLTNFRTQALYRYSFWNEIYETVLAPYILGPTVLAMINPKLGKFNVTAKGGTVKHSYFDERIAWPYIVLILLNVAGLVMVPIRLVYLNPGHPGTIAMNAFWILFNLVILGTANAVAYEPRQLRAEVRISMRRPIDVRLEDGKSVSGETSNMSLGGVMLKLETEEKVASGSKVSMVYLHRGIERVFAAVVVSVKGRELRAAYEPLSLEQEEQMTLLLYTDADMWLSRSENRKPDKPMRNFLHLVRLSAGGVKYALFGWMFQSKRTKAIGVQATILILAMALACVVTSAQTGQKKASQTSSTSTADGSKAELSQGEFQTTMSLGDMGAPKAIVFRGVMSSRDIPFSIPQNVVTEDAKLKLKYGFSTGLIAQLSHLSVFLNGELIATLPVPQNTGQFQGELEQEISLPAELLVRKNVLEFQFVGHYTTTCEDPSNTALWGRVESSSSIELRGSLLTLVNDLKDLPLPFYDGAVGSNKATIPVAFVRPPSKQALQAAGIVTSWFGVVARSRPLVFPVSVGSTLPKGNLILFVESLSDLSPDLKVSAYGPVVAVRTNPSDEHGKVLVIAGDGGEQIVMAARAVALGNPMLQGQTVYVGRMELPPPRGVNDAPLWMRTDTVSPIVQYAGSPQAESDGSGPLPFYLRAPPDLYFGSQQNVPMRLDYQYNAISLANASTLRVESNGSMVADVPLPYENDGVKALSRNVDIPVLYLRPFSNTFQFNFYFQIAKKGSCQDTAPINLKGSILPSSYLDLRGLSHWATMPDLELFANAGFPFTRFADLSQSMVVLPSSASTREIELYLTLIAYMGEQTGYPALRLSVGDEKDLGKDLDYLIIGTPEEQPGFEQLKKKLPVLIQKNGLTVREAGGFFESIAERIYEGTGYRPYWWKLTPRGERPGLIEALEEVPDAVIQGVESPWGMKRSIVTITLRDPDATQNFTEAFWKSSMSDDISKQVSVLHGTTFNSYRLQRSYYHVGHLSPLAWMRYWLRGSPWMIALFTLLLGVFIVPWTKQRLDRRARDRIEARDI